MDTRVKKYIYQAELGCNIIVNLVSVLISDPNTTPTSPLQTNKHDLGEARPANWEINSLVAASE